MLWKSQDTEANLNKTKQINKETEEKKNKEKLN